MSDLTNTTVVSTTKTAEATKVASNQANALTAQETMLQAARQLPVGGSSCSRLWCGTWGALINVSPSDGALFSNIASTTAAFKLKGRQLCCERRRHFRRRQCDISGARPPSLHYPHGEKSSAHFRRIHYWSADYLRRDAVHNRLLSSSYETQNRLRPI
jgi:hypothetical protein